MRTVETPSPANFGSKSASYNEYVSILPVFILGCRTKQWPNDGGYAKSGSKKASE